MDGSGGRIGAKQVTAEQEKGIELFSTEQSLKINAFAGTGKTTTLRVMAESTSRRGLYLAFNRSVADYASRLFPKNVECRTIHSLAYRQVHSRYRSDEKMIGALNRNQVAGLLPFKELSFSNVNLNEKQLASLTLATLKVFMHSSTKEIKPAHMPEWGVLSKLSQAERKSLATKVAHHANQLWQLMCDPKDKTPLGHDGYLKQWALSQPTLDTDFVLLDEAQDSNPVMLDVLAKQTAQVIYVGDRHQQIYQWRGAVNAMEQVETDQSTYLTQSFRFGETVAEVANRILTSLGESQLLRGNPTVPTRIGENTPNAIISRTNAMLVAMVLRELQKNGRPFVEGGTQDLLRLLEGVRTLQRGQKCDQPEFFGFKNWQEFVQFSKSDEGQEWRMLVGLVEDYTVDHLIGTLNRVVQNVRESSVVLSTTHKAKGREWDHVELTDDFKIKLPADPNDLKDYDREENRIAYVALTRAKLSLQVPEELLKILQESEPEKKESSDDSGARKISKKRVAASSSKKKTPK